MPKTKKASTVQMIRLDGIKVGRLNVYLEKSELAVRVGPSGRSMDVLDFGFGETCPDKGKRRAFRKALHKAGHRDLVLMTILPQKLSAEQEANLHVNPETNRW